MHGGGQLYVPGTSDLDVAKQHMSELRAEAREDGRGRRHRARHSRQHGLRRWLHLGHQRQI
jgi:hypothetical protein